MKKIIVLQVLIEHFTSDIIPTIILVADQKLYNTLQKMKTQEEYNYVMKYFHLHLDIWHTLFTAYNLQPTMFIAGFTTDTEYKKPSKWHNLHDTYYTIEALSIATQITILEAM